jgi:uncharacterized protein YrrD
VRRAKTLLDLPIVSLAEGRVVGRVRDVIFDPPGGRIAGLLVKEASLLSDARVVPLERVRTLGDDAITVPDRHAVQPSLRIRPLRRLLNAGVRLNGLHVVTEGGRDLGTVDEVFIGKAGDIVGYELNLGMVAETMRGKGLIPGADVLAAGPDALIVPERVEQLVQQPEQDVEALERAYGAGRASEPVKLDGTPEAGRALEAA